MERIFNTGETQEDLRRQFNPEGSEKRNVQLRLLDMLLYLDGVCKKLDIDYSLEFGNVLGAVRHGGFIPWDDDIDVSIPLKDYNRLTKYLIENPHPQYVIQCPQTDRWRLSGWNTIRDLHSNYVHHTPSLVEKAFKYHGLQIDLFCFMPGRIKWLHRLIGGLHVHICLNNIGKHNWIARAYYCFEKNVLIPIANILSKYFGDKKYVQHNYGSWLGEMIPVDILYPHKPILFEGHYFPGPNKPEEYCAFNYQDYMVLPPKEKRQAHPVNYELW